MAIQLQGSFSTHIIIHQSSPFKKSLLGMMILRKTLLPVRRLSKFQIRSSIKDLVFEDHSTGTVCYKDETGEIICEGLDEGPRLVPQHQSTPLPCLRDEAFMLDRLQQRLLQIMDAETPANFSAVLEEQHSCNGTNMLH